MRENLVLPRITGLTVKLPRHLDRRLHGLRPATSPLQMRVLRRQERQESARHLETPVARPHRRCRHRQAPHLRGGGVDDTAVAVPEAHAERAREPVEVPAPLGVLHANAVALRENERFGAERLHLREVHHDAGDVIAHISGFAKLFTAHRLGHPAPIEHLIS